MLCEGKVVLITGAAQGLGKAIAESLLAQGAKVCVCDVNVDIGEVTVAGLQKQHGQDRVFFMKCDVLVEADLEGVFVAVRERYGGLDIVVNNAGIADEKNWSRMIDINLKSVISGTLLAVDAMSAAGKGGLVVNLASLSGMVPTYHLPVYGASKQAVISFTQSCADNPHYKRANLRFACVCPAFADTAILPQNDLDPRFPYPRQEAQALVDMFGVMNPSKVGEAFLELLQEESLDGALVTVSEKFGTQVKKWRR
ncbi:15-hydroxyprostaglandin dehydrogenase [NAD(+)]-like [Haliotis rubra]|uniref:15-hydroxyprostaglandin dehydrogenase [NAD(+)]-like n=1 Tax=Haliotis rubra TaxID=36100 RepID=UPI001EE505D9|nr:15-hydroxyprostaglandin dehydrogenase [NAD(+)]-like [Haliotis rubra]